MFWTLAALAAAWTAGFELLTCLFRFGLGLRSKVYANRYRRFTLGIRIHHAYFAAAVVPLALGVPMEAWLRDVLLAASAGLVFSDLLHHFVVLPIVTGEFD